MEASMAGRPSYHCCILSCEFDSPHDWNLHISHFIYLCSFGNRTCCFLVGRHGDRGCSCLRSCWSLLTEPYFSFYSYCFYRIYSYILSRLSSLVCQSSSLSRHDLLCNRDTSLDACYRSHYLYLYSYIDGI